MKSSKIFHTLFLAAFMVMASSCSSDAAGESPMYDLGMTYAEIAQNFQNVSEAFQKVYSAPRDQQGVLQQKAQTLAEDVKARNAELASKAKQEGEALLGMEITCETSQLLNYKVEKAVFSTVHANDNLANIVIEVSTVGQSTQKPYFLFMDKNGNLVYKTLGYVSGDKITVNFRITTNKGPVLANKFAETVKLLIVTPQEYEKGSPAADGELALAESGDEKEQEPELTYTGNHSKTLPTKETASAGEIHKGDNLVETLKQFKNIEWDYNADFGVTANVGDYWIVVSDEDLTQEGLEIINAIQSDMENNIQFSINYIKPSAKVGQFEHN